MADKNKYSMELQVNGQSISTNSFVADFYIHSLLGSLQALRDMPEDITSVNISIKRN